MHTQQKALESTTDQRVRGHEAQRRDAERLRVLVELQEDGEPAQELRAEQRDRLRHRDGAARQRARARARDFAVDVAVPQIVDGAAGAAEQLC
jgi:hypothetical protein